MSSHNSTTRNFFIGLVAFALLFCFAVYKTITKAPPTASELPVHWHAPITYEICGEEVLFKEKEMHTLLHGHGDGKIHVEGIVPYEGASRLALFFEATGIAFSRTQIGDRKNGDLCPGSTTPGKVRFYVNGKENFEFGDYVVKDADVIKVEFK